MACTHPPHGNTIDVDVNFSVDLWAYVNILNKDSELVCKFYVRHNIFTLYNIEKRRFLQFE